MTIKEKNLNKKAAITPRKNIFDLINSVSPTPADTYCQEFCHCYQNFIRISYTNKFFTKFLRTPFLQNTSVRLLLVSLQICELCLSGNKNWKQEIQISILLLDKVIFTIKIFKLLLQAGLLFEYIYLQNSSENKIDMNISLHRNRDNSMKLRKMNPLSSSYSA